MAFMKRLAAFLGLKPTAEQPEAEPPADPSGHLSDKVQASERVTLWEHTRVFAGRKVLLYVPGQALADQAPGDIKAVAWRLGGPWCNAKKGSASVSDSLTHISSDPDAAQVEAIVLGAWASWEGNETAETITQLLVASHEKFSGLRHLFFSDIVTEESEISWIEHTNVAPILTAFPSLETLKLRGGGIGFGRAGHPKLTELVVQSGGMPPDGVRDISESDWPSIERLELWLGTDEYGGGAGVADVERLLSGEGLPKVVHLGLMNSNCQDEIVLKLAAAPIVQQLQTLDLSMGTLSDTGAQALIENEDKLRHLKEIRLRWNYISDALTARLAAWPNISGVSEKADDIDEDDEWRYVEVSE